MLRKERDAKFVIYQVLYIFVITVLALKGAGLDLGEVVDKETSVNVSVRDSLLSIVDSLTILGLKFNIEIDTNVVVENEELKEKLVELNKKIQDLNKKVKDIPPEIEKPKEKPKLISPLAKGQTFLQYAWNIAENKGSIPVEIYDQNNLNTPITIVPAGENKRFDLEDQTEVILRFGDQQEVAKVLPNLPPTVNIQTVTTKMSKSYVYARELQRITCFKVTISDERMDQLKITHSGPISVYGPQTDNKGNFVYNVSLRLASSEEKFDEWTEKNENLREPDGRYKANFFFLIIDTRTKQRVQVGDSFYFTDFSE